MLYPDTAKMFQVKTNECREGDIKVEMKQCCISISTLTRSGVMRMHARTVCTLVFAGKSI